MEKKEIIEAKREDVAHPIVPQGAQMLDIISAAVMRQDVSVDTIERLLDAQIKAMDKQAVIEFNQAKARLKFPTIKKSSKSHNNKYAKYEDIHKVVFPIYSKEGFSISFSEDVTGSGRVYTAKLAHSGGHYETASMVLPADTSGSKNAIQAIGSTVSYAKRYLTCMLFNIVTADEDDDGYAGAIETITDEQARVIEEWIESTQSNRQMFLQYMSVGAVGDISAKDYNKAMTALKTKAKKEAEDK